MRRLLLAVPLASLLLQVDRFAMSSAPAPRRDARDLSAALAELPARSEGRFGKPGDALNMLFVGSEESVRRALARAGWTELSLAIAPSVKAGLGQLLRGERLTLFPPMNLYEVLGRTQDMNWAQVVRPIQERHHFRLWRTGLHDPRGRELWWGSGNYDLSVRWRDLSHRPDPDMNLERDHLAKSLAGLPEVESLRLVALPQIPREGFNDKGYPFFTDGRALLAVLR